MEGSRRLILGMAGPAQRRQGREVQRAVNHEAGAGQGVGKDTGRASAVDIGAVVLGVAGSGGAALASDPGKHAGDGGARGRAGRLEVLGHLGGRTRRGNLAGGEGERAAVGHGGAGGGALGAGAVGLDGGALLVEGAAGLAGGGAVDRGRHDVGRERDGALELGRVGVGVLQGAGDLDVVGAALGEIVNLRGIPGGGDGLAGGDQLEGILGEVGSGDAETETVESDGAGWESVSFCGARQGAGAKTWATCTSKW